MADLGEKAVPGENASGDAAANRPRYKRVPWLCCAGVLALGLAAGVVAWLAGWHVGADTAVYRAGALSLLHDESIYGPGPLNYLPDWALLPFIYPPPAALLFLPLAAVPAPVAWGLMSAGSVLAVFVVIRVVLRGQRVRWAHSAAIAAGMAVLAIALEPVWKTLFLGQINILLMALVVVDVLVIGASGSRWGGVLVGMAAAIKLTPLIFVVHLLVVGRRADAARGLGTFAGLQAVMFALIPGQSVRYWSDLGSDLALLDTGDWIFNQSLNGMLLRLLNGAPWSVNVALVLAALLAVPAVWLVWSYARRGDAVTALLITGFFAVLVSPLSWSHHWVWAVPLVALLAARGRWISLAAVLGVFASAVVMIVPNGGGVEYRWGPVEVVFGNLYVLFPIAAGLVLCARALRRAVRAGTADPAG